MAAYREHLTVSALLGVGYGVGASAAFGYSPAEGILAGWLTAMGGIAPDLDSETGRPVREMFGLTAAVIPLLVVSHVQKWTGLAGDIETTMVIVLGMYLTIKYGLAALIAAVSVHRGMFHSIPAMAIAAEIIYLAYPKHDPRAKLLMAGGVAIGFFSHLLLDEIYSVQWSGVRIRLKKSAGSALKFLGDAPIPNMLTYTLLVALSYLMLTDAGVIALPARGVRPTLQAENAADGRLETSTDFGATAPLSPERTAAEPDAPPPPRTADSESMPARDAERSRDGGILR